VAAWLGASTEAQFDLAALVTTATTVFKAQSR